MILEVPVQKKAEIPPNVLDYAKKKAIIIRDVNGKIYKKWRHMKVTFRAWNHGYTELQSEGGTLSRLDGYNKTRYSRRKKQEGLLELASREAHEQQNVYFATILNEDDSPYCAIVSNVGYFGLDFLRDNYDDYLTFQYREQLNQDGKLFLKAIFLYECYPGTDKRMRRIDFTYTHEGGCSSVIYQGEAYDGTFEMITTEHPSISAEELEKLWVDYPKFGEYDQLIRLDRIPLLARDRILEYTDKEFPAFRQYLQRDIERCQEPKQ